MAIVWHFQCSIRNSTLISALLDVPPKREPTLSNLQHWLLYGIFSVAFATQLQYPHFLTYPQNVSQAFPSNNLLLRGPILLLPYTSYPTYKDRSYINNQDKRTLSFGRVVLRYILSARKWKLSINTRTFFFFFFFNHQLYFPAQIGSFIHPQRSSGQAVGSQVSSLPHRTCFQFLSRIGFSIPTARRFSSNVANSRSRVFR